MVEVTIDSVRVSLMSQHRVVVLKDKGSDRFLPIWIGPFEADAITIQLQDVTVARPMTHDLLRSTIEQLGAEVVQVTITAMKDDTYYAEITLRLNGRRLEIDSRPSDAIALAVRARVPVYVADEVMGHYGITPEQDLETGEAGLPSPGEVSDRRTTPDAFKDFLEGLDLSGLE
jgi:bifunctional DNase/RNase